MNPELQRQLWLRINPGRLLAMPLLLGLCFTLAWVLGEEHRGESLYFAALTSFFALLYFWGAKQCSDSLRLEVQENTWEAQRMSVLSPWSMLWGKLLGATALSWYGGLFILAALLLGASLADPAEIGGPPTGKVVLLLILGALMIQSFSLLVRLYIVRTLGNKPGYDALYFLLILYIIGVIGSGLGDGGKPVEWYQWQLEHTDFILASLLFWLPWALFGGYRLMRSELLQRNGPFAWPLFLITLCLYLTGLMTGEESPGRLFASLLLLLIIGYALLLSDRREPLELRRLSLAWQQGNWQAFGEQLPLWVSNLLLAFGCALLLLPGGFSSPTASFSPGVWVLALVLFVTRDALLMHAISFSPRKMRADLAVALSLFVLYLLLPTLLKAVVGGDTALLLLFWPLPDQTSLWLLFAPALEVGLATLWLLSRARGIGLFNPRSEG